MITNPDMNPRWEGKEMMVRMHCVFRLSLFEMVWVGPLRILYIRIIILHLFTSDKRLQSL